MGLGSHRCCDEATVEGKTVYSYASEDVLRYQGHPYMG
jgi:hypothetical protein